MTPNKITNIGLGQRRLRLFVGALFVWLSIGLALFFLGAGAPRVWRLLVYLPLAVGVGALVEVRAKTCVALGLSGQCSLSPRLNLLEAVRGQKVADPALAATLRQRALKLALQIQVIVIACTAVLFILPM